MRVTNSMKALLALAISAAAPTIVAGQCADGSVGTSLTYTGYMIDNLCWDAPNHRSPDGSKMDVNPEDHTKKCLLMPPCIASGYSILEMLDDGTYAPKYVLDEASTAMAVEMVEASDKEDDFVVTVEGVDCGDTVSVSRILLEEEVEEEEEEEGKATTTEAAAPDGTMDDDAEPNDANNAKEGGDKVDSSSKEAGRDPPPKAGDATAGWGSSSSADGSGTGGSNFPVPLPFIVVNTSSQAVIKCDMNPDRTDVMFDFSLPFEINDDNEILKRLQLDKTTMEDASRLFPRDLFTYAQEHRLLDHVLVSPDQMPDFHPAPLVTSAPAAVPSADPSVAPLLDDAAEPLAYDVASSSAAGAGVSTDNQARNAYYPPRNSSGAYAMPPSERHIAASDDVPTARSD
mmetsp:Transcript_5548/g.11735  ORF Transcript_5548/g.11735 Transcript_5548/m.11735 type:complete len:400 (+) Transcript_5548:189-1388(+)